MDSNNTVHRHFQYMAIDHHLRGIKAYLEAISVPGHKPWRNQDQAIQHYAKQIEEVLTYAY